MSIVEITTLAAKALAQVLGDRHYAVVGGAAGALLGSGRTTLDVDIVVLKGDVSNTKNCLKNSPSFKMTPKTRHVVFISHTADSAPVEVDIDILAPPMMWQEPFDENTPTITFEGVKVLAPICILNAKCRCILSRSDEKKKFSDASDIVFWLGYLARSSEKPRAGDLPNFSRDFVEWLTKVHNVDVDLWEAIGYDSDKGTLRHALYGDSIRRRNVDDESLRRMFDDG
ncbi:MAG: hypothetical protein M1823_002962 [Watsoniomyces obsoletus]|nr:MAG: hypothetical protein M1823_002962 [Watsoniomyces obsoletus]